MRSGRASRQHNRNLVLLFVAGVVTVLCVLAVTLVLGIQEPRQLPTPPASSGQPGGVSGTVLVTPSAPRLPGGVAEPTSASVPPSSGGIHEPALTSPPDTPSVTSS